MCALATAATATTVSAVTDWTTYFVLKWLDIVQARGNMPRRVPLMSPIPHALNPATRHPSRRSTCIPCSLRPTSGVAASAWVMACFCQSKNALRRSRWTLAQCLTIAP